MARYLELESNKQVQLSEESSGRSEILVVTRYPQSSFVFLFARRSWSRPLSCERQILPHILLSGISNCLCFQRSLPRPVGKGWIFVSDSWDPCISLRILVTSLVASVRVGISDDRTQNKKGLRKPRSKEARDSSSNRGPGETRRN